MKKEKVNKGILELAEIVPIISAVFKLDIPYQDKLEMCVFELAKEERRVKKEFTEHMETCVTPIAKMIADKICQERIQMRRDGRL